MTKKEFCAEILAKILVEADTEIHIQGLPASNYLESMLEMESFMALNRIREILDDDSLDDRDCFVCTFEELGPGGGSRHDFG